MDYSRSSHGRRGISVLEALIAGVILVLGVVAWMGAFKYIAKQRTAIEAGDAIDRIDGFVRKEVQARVIDFMVGGTCSQAALLNALTFDSLSGFRVAPMLPADASPKPVDGPRARIALARCAATQTAFVNAAGVGAAPFLHFCLRIAPVPGDGDAAESFIGMQALFGEFVFAVTDPRNGNRFGCSNLAAAGPWRAASLNYGLYWSGADETPRTNFGNVVLGTL